MQRNYQELSPFDFECLVRDLLQEHLRATLEVFPPGRDGGVDVRLLADIGQNKYVQCKHSPLKNYAAIKSSLRGEAAKVARLKGEYWLVTSASLTAANKKDIASIFNGRLEERCILSRLDCDNLLNLYPHVEERHYKLYLNSVAVLRRVLASEFHFRRDALFADFEQRVRIFVQTPAFQQAIDMIREHGTCIISGEPGIGKTTLAEMLLLKFAEEEYEVIVVSEDAAEAEQAYVSDRKQAFFYDDFLGQTSLAEKLGKNEDDRLLRIIRRFATDDTHVLLMTTREYILTQARQTYARLQRGDLDVYKFVLDLKSYNQYHRAQILYNHIYFSTLSRDAVNSVLSKRKYRKIVSHRNYNPRLIEMIVRFAIRLGPPGDGVNFADFALATLADPGELWRDVFDGQLSQVDRDLLVTLSTFHGGRAKAPDLRSALERYCNMAHGSRPDFFAVTRSLDVLNGVILKIEASGDVQSHVVRLGNPSFRDFLTQYLAVNLDLLRPVILGGGAFFDQYEVIDGWTRSGYLGGFPRPGELKDLVHDNIDAFIHAASDALNSPSPRSRLDWTPGGSYFSDSSMREYANRAECVARMISRVNSVGVGPVVGFALNLQDVWRTPGFWSELGLSGKRQSVATIRLLLDTAHAHRSEISTLLPMAVAGMSTLANRGEDYRYRAELLVLAGAPLDDLAEEFSSQVDALTSQALDTNTVEEAEAERNILQETADLLELDISESIDEIDDHIEYLDKSEPGDDGDGAPTMSSVDDRDYGVEIDMLFDTLRAE